MRRIEILVHGIPAGFLDEKIKGLSYSFVYNQDYSSEPVSLSMPVERKEFVFDTFPPFFDGLLPEGMLLDALLRIGKIDRDDLMSQLAAVGNDMVGSVTVREEEI